MDLRKMATNLIPFPRLKFLSISDAPMMYKKAQKYTKITVESLITQLFHRHQFLSHIDVGAEHHGFNGIYLAASVIVQGGEYHGQHSSEWEIESSLKRTLAELRYNGEAMRAIPNPLHATLVHQGIPGNSLVECLYGVYMKKDCMNTEYVICGGFRRPHCLRITQRLNRYSIGM